MVTQLDSELIGNANEGVLLNIQMDAEEPMDATQDDTCECLVDAARDTEGLNVETTSGLARIGLCQSPNSLMNAQRLDGSIGDPGAVSQITIVDGSSASSEMMHLSGVFPINLIGSDAVTLNETDSTEHWNSATIYESQAFSGVLPPSGVVLNFLKDPRRPEDSVPADLSGVRDWVLNPASSSPCPSTTLGAPAGDTQSNSPEDMRHRAVFISETTLLNGTLVADGALPTGFATDFEALAEIIESGAARDARGAANMPTSVTSKPQSLFESGEQEGRCTADTRMAFLCSLPAQ